MIYILIFTLLLILSYRYDIMGKTKYREHWYLAVLIIFILVAGLRWRLGIDTPNYINYFYHAYPDLKNFSFEDYPIGKDPFYVLINSVVKSLGGKFYIVQLIQATIVNGLIFKYIKKHCNSIFTCLVLYFTCYCYMTYSMEIMRGAISISICLFGNDYILDKKWAKGYLLYALALMFHAQTVVLLVLPLLFFLRLNKFGIVALLAAFVAGYLVQVVLGDYLMLLDMDSAIVDKAGKYAENDRFGKQGGNLNFIIVYILPNMIYGILALIFMKRYHRQNRLLQLEPLVMIGMLFLMAQMSLQIAYRFVDYYRIYFIMFCADSFVFFTKDHDYLSKGLAYCRAWIIIFPFVFLISYPNLTFKRIRYVPYSSVIERKVDKDREALYAEDRPSAHKDEY